MPKKFALYDLDDHLEMPAGDVIDVTPEPDPLYDEMEYLDKLYDDDGIPIIEKILLSHPFVRIVDYEPPKGFWERLREFLKI
ncbi:MAG: hypothetical protein WCO26_00595 [Deltaproteobacteria bacterium]